MKEDSLFKMTENDIQVAFAQWFDDCDPSLRQQRYGWGSQDVINPYIKSHSSTDLCYEYYTRTREEQGEDDDQFTKDKLLCEGICNLHIFHTIAREWIHRNHVCQGSYEQQVLFHVLKHNLVTKNADITFMIRLFDVASKYNIYQKKPVRNTPIYQQTALAIFLYPNLHFLVKLPSNHYALSCENIKEVSGFEEVIRQANTVDSGNNCVPFNDKSYTRATKEALDYVIKKWDSFLQKRYPMSVFQFKVRPLVLKREMSYCVSYDSDYS